MHIYVISIFFFIASFLNPVHYVPWVSFDSEMYAVIGLFLLLINAFIDKNKKFSFNIKIFIPFIFLSSVVFFQFFNEIITFQKMMISIYYFLVAFLCLVLGIYYRINFYYAFQLNLNRVIILICLLSFAVSLFQFFNFENNFIMDLVGSRWYGNTGQANHYSTLMCMGVCALILTANKKNIFYTIFLIFCYSLCIFKSGSLTGFLILFLLPFIFIFLNRKINILVFIPILCWIGINFIEKYFFYDNSSVVSKANIDNPRFTIWGDAIEAVLHKPNGYGWLNGSISEIYNSRFPHVVNYFHNIFLDIFTWNGIFLGFIIILYLFICFYFMIKTKNSLLLLIFPILIHSMFEYPIYYFYFLIPFFIIVGFICYELFDLDKKNNNKLVFFLVSIFLSLSFLINKDFDNVRRDAYFSSFGDCSYNSYENETIILKDLQEYTNLPCYIHDQNKKAVEVIKLYPYKVFVKKYLEVCDQDCDDELINYYNRKF